MTWENYSGYAKIISNWRGIKCEYATNKPVAKYYGNKNVKSYRFQHRIKISQTIQQRPITVGIDYYALYGVCGGMFPVELLQKHYLDLVNGKVFVYTIVAKENKIYFIEKK